MRARRQTRSGEVLPRIPCQRSHRARRIGVSNVVRHLRAFLAVSIMGGSVQPVLAMGGGGPPGWKMTQDYCREMVVNKGITEVTRFEQELRKCIANPVTYPPTYKKSW